MPRARILALLGIVILIAIFAVTYRIRYLSHQLTLARDEVAAATLERDGFKRALEVKPREIINTLPPEIREVVKQAVKRGDIVPTIVTQIETVEKPIYIPCPDNKGIQVNVQMEGTVFVGMTHNYTPFSKSNYFVRLTQPPPSTWKVVTQFNDPQDTIIQFDENLLSTLRSHADERRFTAAPRKISQWRTGWVIGAGLSYDPFQSRVAPALFAGYGFQF